MNALNTLDYVVITYNILDIILKYILVIERADWNYKMNSNNSNPTNEFVKILIITIQICLYNLAATYG